MRVLVVGGTGTVGSEVARQLLERGFTAKVLTRSAEKAGALRFEASVGDLGKPDTLPAAFENAEGAFVLAPLGRDETKHALNAVEAARAARVSRLVYMSVVMPPGSETIPHFASKIPVEEAVRRSGMSWAVLRPNNFFQNDLVARDAIVRDGVYPYPIGSRGLNRVDVRDIAEAAVNAFARPELHGVFPINGPRGMTGEDTARVYAEHLGRPVRYIGDDLDSWATHAASVMPGWLVEDLRIMYKYFQQYGLHASGTDFAAQEQLLGHAPRPFEAFASEAVATWKTNP